MTTLNSLKKLVAAYIKLIKKTKKINFKSNWVLDAEWATKAGKTPREQGRLFLLMAKETFKENERKLTPILDEFESEMIRLQREGGTSW